MLIAAPRLRGAARLVGAWPSPDSEIMAVASDFPLLTAPPARASYQGQRLRHRLGLYRRGEAAPFATFDGLGYPVTAIAFHPSEPMIAVGAGSYDGGWMFDGDLALWNWRDGTVRRPFAQVPEVVDVRFGQDEALLEVQVRPWDESPESVGEDTDPFRSIFKLTVRLNERWPLPNPNLDPAKAMPETSASGSLTPDDLDAAALAAEPKVAAWLGVPALDLPGAVWAVAGLNVGQIAAATEDGRFRLHAREGGEVLRLEPEEERRPVAILPTTPPIVHLASRPHPRFDGRTWLATLEAGRLMTRAELDGSWLFSTSANGRLMGRLDRSFGNAGADLVMDVATGAMRRLDLGRYDVFNHHLRIDGAPDLYFLQATPPEGHERKWLCRLGANDTVERLWPVLPDDGTPAAHAMDCCGGWVEDADWPAILLAGMHYSPDPRAPRRGFLYRRAPHGKAEAWRQETAAGCSAMVFLKEAGLIAAAFLDGTLRLIDARSGETRVNAPVVGAGQPTVIFALAAEGWDLVIGTFDGVVATLGVERLVDGAPDVIDLDGR